MSIFSIEEYKINDNKLEIYVNESKMEAAKGIEVVFRNRKNKNRTFIIPKIRSEKDQTILIINFNDLNMNLPKNIIDLALKINNKEYRLYKEVNNLSGSVNRYSGSHINVDNNKVVVPYLTTKSELSILYGAPSDVFRGYCTVVKGKISASNEKFNGKVLSFTLKDFEFNKYSHVNITVQSNNGKKIESLKYDYSPKYNIFSIDLTQFKNISLNSKYGLFLELKIGNILKSLRLGVHNNSLNDEMSNNREYINELGTVIPFITDKGALSVTLANNHAIDLREYDIVNGRINVNDVRLNKDNLQISLNDRENELDVYKKSIVLQGVNKKYVLTLNENQYCVKDNSELELYLNKIFIYDIFNKNQKWKVTIKLYDEENKIIKMNDLIKESNWVAPAKERYSEPITLDSGTNLINYISEKNEVSFLIGGMDEYKREIYQNFAGTSEIDNIEVEGNNLSFDIIDFNKELVENLSIIFVERKSKKVWNKDIDILDIKNNRVVVDLIDFIHDNYNFASRWDAYIQVTYDYIISKNRIGQFNKKLLPTFKRYYSFVKTEGENVVSPYLTIKNELSIVINKEITVLNEKLKSKISLNKLDMKNNIITGEVELELQECEDYIIDSVILKYRSSIEDKSYKIFTESEKIKGNKSLVRFSLDLCKYEFDQFYWDFFVIVKVDNEEYMIKIKNPKEEVKSDVANKIIKFSYTDKNGYLIYPYISRVGSLAISYRKKAYYESNAYKIKENLAYYTYKIFKNYFDKKDIWLGYEKFSEGAQDNGFYFFEYCYKNNKKKNFYYIIKKDSNDFENLKSMKDKVLDFMSFKYMIYMYAAKLLVSSESKGHSYDVRIEKGRLKKALDKKKIVFLQHGVIALKKIDYIFKKSKGNVVDLFVVSSDYEKNIIKNHFDYDENEIINTGLCRWDVLEDKSNSENREILLMPTWRSWMDGISEEKFIETDYYKNYLGLLNSNKLQEIVEKNNIKLSFFIHPKFKEYIGKFTSNNKNINIYEYGEVKVNDLLMKSSMLITDYSSVAWDMYYQKKPIVFYQFDIEEYDKYQGSYLDMETELFGDRVFKLDELIEVMEEYISNDFEEKEEFADMRSKYFSHVDKNNCERTYKTIMSKRKNLYKINNKNNIYSKLRKNSLVKKVWKRLNRNKYTRKITLTIKRVVK